MMWNAEGPGDTVNEVGTSGEAEGKDREITNVMNEEKIVKFVCACGGLEENNLHLNAMFTEYRKLHMYSIPKTLQIIQTYCLFLRTNMDSDHLTQF